MEIESEFRVRNERRGASLEDLFQRVYRDLHQLARRYMAAETDGHTLEPIALVHEAYMRLARQAHRWRNPHQLLVAGARVMQEVLIDDARHRARAKRGGGWHRVPFDDRLAIAPSGELDPAELMTLRRALAKLEALNHEEARVIGLRFVLGLTVAETATVMAISKRAVENDWTRARKWLRRDLTTMTA